MRFVVLVLAAALAIAASLVPPSGSQAQALEGTVQINPSISTVSADRVFTVYVLIDELQHIGRVGYDDNRDTVPDRFEDSIGLGAFEFSIQFDPAVLAVDGVLRGPGLSSTGRNFQCLPPAHDPGSIAFGCISAGAAPDGPQGTITLAEVAFRPVASGSSALMLEATLSGPLGTDNVAIDARGAAVRVTGKAAATPTPRNGGGDDDDPPPGVTGNSPASTQVSRTPGVGDATSVRTSGPGPSGSTTPDAEDGGTPQDQVINNPRDGNGPEPDDSAVAGDGGRSFPTWAIAVLAGATAVGLALGGVLWYRRQLG